MPDITSNDSLREEFNRWAEAGRGEGMEQDHLPITLPVLEKMRLAPTDNVLDVGCGAGWLSRRVAGMGAPAAGRVGFRGGWRNWCPKVAWWGWTFRTK